MISVSLFNVLMILICTVTGLGLMGVWLPEVFFNEVGIKLFLTFGVMIVSIIVTMAAFKMFGPELEKPSNQITQNQVTQEQVK